MGRETSIPVRVGHFWRYLAGSAVSYDENALYWPRLFPPDLLKHLLIFHDSHNCP